MLKTEFSEVLKEIIFSHFPKIGKEHEALLEDIVNHVGAVDYRLKYDNLCWEHCACLEKLKSFDKNPK